MRRLAGLTYEDWSRDALHINSDKMAVIGCTLTDTRADHCKELAAEAHRDCIQIIPPSVYMLREQYAAGIISDVRVVGNRMSSNGYCQGIFMADGLAKNLQVIGNTISTLSEHHISIAGLLSGTISDNILPSGQPCPINLYSLRIGGNPRSHNVRILSFSSEQYRYDPVSAIVDQSTLAACVVNDWRTEPRYKSDIHLINFDKDGFRETAAKLGRIEDALQHALQLQRLAIAFGERV